MLLEFLESFILMHHTVSSLVENLFHNIKEYIKKIRYRSFILFAISIISKSLECKELY